MDATKKEATATSSDTPLQIPPKNKIDPQGGSQDHQHPPTQPPTEGLIKGKRKRRIPEDAIFDKLEKTEKRSLKRRKAKKPRMKKEPFFIDPISGPVTNSPDRTPPLSPGVFDGELTPEEPVSDIGSPTSTQNHSDSSGKSL